MTTVTSETVKFVVCDENLLGYIFESKPNIVCILSKSRIKGCSIDRLEGYKEKSYFRKIRQASVKDFDVYRVSVEPYLKSDNNIILK